MTTADATRLVVLVDSDNATASLATELFEEITPSQLWVRLNPAARPR